MVKNTKGGKGHKSLGRKHQVQTNNILRLSTDPLEKYAFITKIFGGGMCEVWYIDDKNSPTRIIGHIRKKMKGRQKRHNTIVPNSYVLVGLREWETEAKNCDIICIYDVNQVEQLKQNPSINISELSKFNTNVHENKLNDDDEYGLSFSDDIDEDINTNEITENFITNNGEEVNIDDI